MAGDRQRLGAGYLGRRSRRCELLPNLAVDDLDRHLADLAARGLVPGAIETANKGVRLSAITDPDGNTITFIGNFRTKDRSRPLLSI